MGCSMSYSKFISIAIILVVVGGCAAVPSPSAAKIIEADDAMVVGCQLVGTVFGSSLIGGVVTTGATNAMVDAKEKAANQGATHIVFGNVDGGGMYSVGRATARAYKCPAAK